MNDLRKLLDLVDSLSEDAMTIGDGFHIECGDTLIESTIIDFTDDGVIVQCDDTALSIIGELQLDEAKYHGRTVPLNKPMRGDVAKSKVYVKDPSTGNIKKVNFGDKNMRIKKSIPGRRKSFRARHNCDNPGPKTKARYWSCRAW